MSEQFAVISDLHANARAVTAAIAQARAVGFDQLVVLGDLLTYGDDVTETLDLVEAELERGAALVTGNHDRLYLDLADGKDAYYAKLPDWLRETVDHTLAKLDIARFRALPWRDEIRGEGVLLAHANPFAFGDWTYLDSEHDLSRASARLAERGFWLGCFGHTHRPRVYGAVEDDDGVCRARPGDAVVVNSGSVGQPRNKTATATFLRMTLENQIVSAHVEVVTYDVTAHLDALTRTTLSEATKHRLRAFFTPP